MGKDFSYGFLAQEKTGNQAEATKHREVAAVHEKSVELYNNAAQAYAAGRVGERNSWSKAGEFFILVDSSGNNSI